MDHNDPLVLIWKLFQVDQDLYILRLPACSIRDIFNPVLSVTSLILFYLWHLSWQSRQLPPRVKEIEIHIQWYFILAFIFIFANVNVHCTFTFANININASMKYHFYLCCVRMASINAFRGKFIIKTFRFVCFYPQWVNLNLLNQVKNTISEVYIILGK